MAESRYEKQISAILKEVEKILREAGWAQSLTLSLELNGEEIPTISYEIEGKAVRW